MESKLMTTSELTTGEIVRALRCDGDIDNKDCSSCHYDEYGCCGMKSDAADRLESQEQKIAELTKQNKELVETVLRKIGVSYSKNVEGSLTFCGLTMDEAVDRIMQFPHLTARAEQAEAREKAAVKDLELVLSTHHDYETCWACKKERTAECDSATCKPEWRGQPQEGGGK